MGVSQLHLKVFATLSSTRYDIQACTSHLVLFKLGPHLTDGLSLLILSATRFRKPYTLQKQVAASTCSNSQQDSIGIVRLGTTADLSLQVGTHVNSAANVTCSDNKEACAWPPMSSKRVSMAAQLVHVPTCRLACIGI